MSTFGGLASPYDELFAFQDRARLEEVARAKHDEKAAAEAAAARHAARAEELEKQARPDSFPRRARFLPEAGPTPPPRRRGQLAARSQ
jgi:hypothetical protein